MHRVVLAVWTLFCFSAAPFNVHAQELRPRSSKCLTGPLVVLGPLATEPAILSYCSAHYPVPPKTKTVTVTAGVHKRAATTTPAKKEAKKPSTTTTTTRPIGDKLFNFISQASTLVGSVCTCFEGTQTVTTTVNVSPTSGSGSVPKACTNYFICGDLPAGHCPGSSNPDCLCFKRFDEAGGICGVGSTCVACRFDSDCDAGGGGICTSADSCCGLPVCVYKKNYCS